MLIDVTISGVSPLLMNRFTEKAQAAVEAGTSATLRGSKGTPREQAEDSAYRMPDGTLYLPGTAIFAAIISAGRFHKAGKRALTTARESIVPAAVFLQSVELSLKTKDFEVDSRPVVVPATGGRIMKHRPRLDTWATSFTLELDESVMEPKLLRVLVDDAGKKIGVGDFRPARKGPFGRFVVTNCKEVKRSLAA
jgi:hypothetical protein